MDRTMYVPAPASTPAPAPAPVPASVPADTFLALPPIHLKCPGLRFIARPITYRLCHNDIEPNLGCCVKCLAWPIEKADKDALKFKANECMLMRTRDWREVAVQEYGRMRIAAHYGTVKNILSSSLQDAFQKDNSRLVERMLAPVAHEYGDVDVGDSIDIFE